MEIYTLNYFGFNRDTVIDEYQSLIWTERWIEAGDFTLVAQASNDLVKALAPETLLGVSTSRQVMLIDTRNIKDGLITATGKSLDAFFAERYIDAQHWSDTGRMTMKRIVDEMQARNAGRDAILGLLTGGVVDDSGGADDQRVEYGTVYDALKKVAQKYNLDFGVYWERNELGTHDLVFRSRETEDLTDHILFSPALDNIAHVEEISSDVDFKSVVVVNPPDIPSASGIGPYQMNNLHGDLNPFARRVTEIDASDITEDSLEGDTPEARELEITTIMQDKAYHKLIELKKKRAADGEVSPETQFKYYSDYNPTSDRTYKLGDQVRIAGNFTPPVKGRITEYIRSADATGVRAYPTVALPADAPGGDSS